ncbi:ureidoglycolate lyase [Photobacterium sp. WH77]|uniref:Ureidoglycolate lyase n=2 Tax=Photobacterium TaxID=657 RepID=A0A0F5VH94_9GAMM|nr:MULTISPECIES: ureidoglycolate lyase [Photobacterium]KKD00860.1 ureidoglycolate hydrolase [Photobacterium halotolerans]MBD8512224.1 ureidoglycolate lyase [Photobacterium arenosum]MCG2836474.1 ureidoglycolate lyase [Photobacterium sp. WH77]MCG2843899.1 ureidoglycolate lyase [Photobacterium sp. WH80]MDO6581290.1 ureidoglycolate lyase [Photobacterium sp. 2_MG-2023]
MSTPVRQLTIEPLTREAFAPFGDVIDKEVSDYFMINNGSTRRYHAMANVDVQEEGGSAIISIFEAQPLSYPLQIAMMERHPLGSQAFIPLLGNPYLILVAPAGDTPDPAQLKAFYSNGRQGVNYGKGVWHHPVLALRKDDQFLVVDRAGPGNNCDEVYFSDDVRIELSLSSLEQEALTVAL